MSNYAISIMGPTASGKTSLGIKLAKELNGEIISVDSALIYKDMNIGTAKPTLKERDGVVHHLIDILDPKDSYSVASFRNDTIKLYHEITSRGKVPILVGGTMMYFKAITEGLSNLPESTKEVRDEVNSIIQNKGLNYLREQLKLVDLDSYNRLNENDSQRLGRAYEVYLMTNKSMTQLLKEAPVYKAPFELKEFALLPDRERLDLKKVITQRFNQMIEQGFEEEVRALFNRKDLNMDMPSIRSVGYRQMWQYFLGELSFEEMIERSIIATCQLAKRQMTWLRGWKSKVTYLKPGDSANLEKMLLSLNSDQE
ncbi:MAG: tRNA (adenosine(37)-N6)-dimethylallyltransferase MiaA [Succinivibrionaceae bacterium]|nr:tRNA (adenosine(37)-N6)-dimethylallyltransferase MiaA [Ruminobacter sp.]MDY5779182.1 tRNA (adenosine(37)-N6)-dimethylallyltransferase MiaA [Succinivibrionaceae bacterium]MEE1340666.1 tRNA (adenosine(37)-N6)-dimethylallyltransferase MiaA [Succinivibrionaceae bacterium]